MKLRLALVLLLFPFLARSATEWPVIGLEILPGGWEIAATVSTSPDLGSTEAVTNLNFFGGWNESRDSIRSTNNLVLDVTGQGYDSTGNLVAKHRRLKGTRIKRLNFPSMNTNVVVAQNVTNVHLLIASSDYIYAGETVTATSKPGWLATTNDAANWTNAATFTALLATNSSTLSHVEPSVNWAWPGNNRWTNTTEYVAVHGGHWSGIAGIRMDAIDENSNTNTSWAVRMQHSFGSGPLRDTWVAAIDTSAFSNFNRIRVDYTVFPEYGDVVFSTLSNRWIGLTILPTSQTNFLDRYNAFTNIAVVSLTGGGANQAITNGDPESVSSDQYFLAINTAANRLSAKNWDDIGIAQPIGTIYVREGITNQSGTSLSVSNKPYTWTIIESYPGETATLTNRNGDNDLTDLVKFERIRLGSPPSNIIMLGCDEVWVSNCEINAETTVLWSTCTRVNYTGVNIVRSRSGLSAGTQFYIMRDIDLSGLDIGILMNNALGINSNSKTNLNFNLITQAAGLLYYPTHTIWRDFELYGLVAGSVPVTIGGISNQHYGMWLENVLVEGLTNSSFSTWATGDDTNVVIKNCTFLGSRNQLFYNSSSANFHHQARIFNSHFSVAGFASDDSESNSALTNNHPQKYMVGYQGNVFNNSTNFAFHGTADFRGIDTYMPFGQTGDSNYVKWVDYQAWMGSGIAAGMGDYRLRSDNEILKLKQRDLGGTDLYGQNYGSFRAPGAIGSGNARKGVMFW